MHQPSFSLKISSQTVQALNAPHKKKVSLLIVEPMAILRDCLHIHFARFTNVEVCGSVGDAARAVSMIERHNPDVILLELALPDKDGLEFLKELHASHPKVKLLVFTVFNEKLYGERALRAGATGYVTKNASFEDLVKAVEDLLFGRRAVSGELAQILLENITNDIDGNSGTQVDQLSDRELAVFRLIGQGLGTREIARRLGRGVKTIETYRHRIKHKLNLESGVSLTTKAAIWVSEHHN